MISSYLSSACHVEKYVLFVGEDRVLVVNGDDEDRVEMPLSGVHGDRFSSLAKVPGCQEYLLLLA